MRRILSVVLSLCLLLSTMTVAFAAEASGPANDTPRDGRPAFETLDLEDTTSGDGIDPLSLDENGRVRLTNAAAVQWIDRIEIPDYARAFYDTLVEGADNDGIEDVLINVMLGERVSGGGYGIPVTEISGQGDTFAEMYARCQADKRTVERYIQAVMDAFERDHPEVFWLTGSYTVSYVGTMDYSGHSYQLTCYFILSQSGRDIRNVDLYPTARTIRTAITLRDAWVGEILAGMPASAKLAADKLAYLNTWLTTHNQSNILVDSEYEDRIPFAARECISALEGNIGMAGPTCEGYAKAFKVLCDALGIPCVLVSGADHMWNCVQVGGIWYAVDVTWNDPLGGVDGPVSGYEGSLYLLVGADTALFGMSFVDSHPVENIVSYDGTAFLNGPELSAERYIPGVSPVFSDIPAGAYYADAVAWAVANGITGGTGNGTAFSPNDPCTRKEIVVFLWRAAGEPEPVTTENPFLDVAPGDFWYKAVLWAVENKITSGTSATTFAPDGVCTRAQVMTFLWRCNGSPIVYTVNPFTDVSRATHPYYYDAIKWAVENKITAGTSATTFSPDKSCTRAEVVTFLYRSLA